MATIQVWPKIGLTVYKQDGNSTYVSGETVTLDIWVQRRLDQGDLLDHDPAGDPVLAYIDTASTIFGLITTELSTVRGRSPNQITRTTGKTAVGDGLGSNFLWDPSSTTAEDSDVYWGTGATGRWIKQGSEGTIAGQPALTAVAVDVTSSGTLGIGSLANSGLPNATHVVLTSSGSFTLYGQKVDYGTGLQVPTVTYSNGNAEGGYSIAISHADASAADPTYEYTLPVAERSTYVLRPGDTISINYDYTAQRWLKTEDSDALIRQFLVDDFAAYTIRRDGEQRIAAGKSAAGDAGSSRWRGVIETPLAETAARKPCANGNFYLQTDGASPTLATAGITTHSDPSGFTGTDQGTAIATYFATPGAADAGNDNRSQSVDLRPRYWVGSTFVEVTSTITVDNHPRGGVRYRCGGAARGVYKGVVFVWTGNNTDPMFDVQCSSSAFENLGFAAGGGKTLASVVRLSNPASGICSANSWIGCRFGEIGATWGDIDEHVVLESAVPSNCENMLFDECNFLNALTQSVRIDGGQPFKWVFRRSDWSCELSAGGKVTGTCLTGQSAISQILFDDCGWESVETILGPNAIQYVRWVNCQAESWKAWIYETATPSATAGYARSLEHCRLSGDMLDSATEHFAASTTPRSHTAFLVSTARSTLNFKNSRISSGHYYSPYIKSYGAVSAEDSLFCNDTFLGDGLGALDGTSDYPSARLEQVGCYGYNAGGTIVPLPELRGTRNPATRIRFTEGYSRVPWTFGIREQTTNYQVQATPRIISGTPATPRAWITDQDVYGCYINIDPTPGSGEEIEVEVRSVLTDTTLVAPLAPSDIASCVAWFDSTTLPADLSVSPWVDSVNSYNATPPGTAPVVAGSGYQYIVLTGAECLSLPSAIASIFNGTAKFTVAVNVKRLADVNYATLFSATSSGAPDNRQTLATNTVGGVDAFHCERYDGTTNQVLNTEAASIPLAESHTFILSWGGAASTGKVYRDGVVLSETADQFTEALSGLDTATIGALNALGVLSRYFQGDVGDVAIFSDQLSDADAKLLTAFLQLRLP